MTTIEFHNALHDCGFYRTDTGGGCDAMVRTFPDDARIMLTCADDPSVPDGIEDVCIGILPSDGSHYYWTATAKEALHFALSVDRADSVIAEFS